MNELIQLGSLSLIKEPWTPWRDGRLPEMEDGLEFPLVPGNEVRLHKKMSAYLEDVENFSLHDSLK